MRCFFLALEVFRFSCWFWLLLLLFVVVVVVPKASPSFQTSTYLPCSHMAKGGSGNLNPADRSLNTSLPFEGVPTGVVIELLSLKVCMAVDVTAIGVFLGTETTRTGCFLPNASARCANNCASTPAESNTPPGTFEFLTISKHFTSCVCGRFMDVCTHSLNPLSFRLRSSKFSYATILWSTPEAKTIFPSGATAKATTSASCDENRFKTV